MLSLTIKIDAELGNAEAVSLVLEALKKAPEGVDVTIQGTKDDYTFQGAAIRIVNGKHPFHITCEN